jgi:hypothetical protein
MSRDQNAGYSHNIRIDNSSFKRIEELNIGKTLNKSKFYSRRNKELVEVRECLLSVATESSVFQFPIQKCKDNVCRTLILPVVLCGCDTWSLTLREERRLRVSENRVLRRIFGPRSDEVTGEWRKLRKEEIYDL